MHCNGSLTKYELMAHQADIHYLSMLVAELRIKLGDEAAAPKYIHTEAGVGLRFNTD